MKIVVKYFCCRLKAKIIFPSVRLNTVFAGLVYDIMILSSPFVSLCHPCEYSISSTSREFLVMWHKYFGPNDDLITLKDNVPGTS